MEEPASGQRYPVRRAISYLISTGPAGDGRWRWRLTTVLALLGPGSVPLALLLYAVQTHDLRSVLGISWSPVIGILTGSAVVIARFRPVTAWTLAAASIVLTAIGTRGVVDTLPWPVTVPTLLALLVVQFAAARDRRAWVSIGIWAATLAVIGTAAWALADQRLPQAAIDPNGSPNPGSDTAVMVAVYAALAFLAGLTVRIWRQGRARVAEEEQIATAERTRRRMLEERTRIARELHDIVAHHMSVIAVQSSTAEYRLSGLDEAAKAEFRSLGDQARASLAEMRRLLGVLRSDSDTGPREPMPGPEALTGLVESVDRAGTPVSLEVSGLPEHLPESIALTVYRVAQEALSNVVRHAAGAPTEVRVRGTTEAIVVSVVNGPPPAGVASPEPAGAGMGLAGMRERVGLAGGTLETGPAADGGYRVRAELPLDAASTAQEPTS